MESGEHSRATIAAISSPPGAGERAVVRVSGADARRIVRELLVEDHPLEGRCAFEARIRDGRGEQPVLVLWMPGPRSFTREDVAELHTPGCEPLARALFEHVLARGAERAGGGEFTRRAFEHGRIDLTRAEGVLALVEAQGEHERRAATLLLEGGLAERIAALRDAFEELRALCEASLDFAEDDAGHVGYEELDGRAAKVLADLDRALAWEERREPLSGVPRVVLAGAPNAGKSSLFNRLCGGRALISDWRGTTRDPVHGWWQVAGTRCLLIDTAGVDAAATGEVDAAAQELGRAERAGADWLLWVGDASAPERAFEGAPVGPGALGAPDAPDASGASGASGAPEVARWALVWNKTDLAAPPASLPPRWGGCPVVALSARTGAGVSELEALLARRLHGGAPAAEQALGPELSVRHRRALALSAGRLREARALLAGGAPLDLVAEALRSATDALDAIVGRTSPEDLLDRIFARFCLGK